ncbi:MAG: glycosyltransferase family 39 protein [Bacteroidota bacterium]
MNTQTWLFAKHTNKLILACILLNLAIAIPFAANLNLRSDEGYAMESSSRDFAYAVDQAIHFELQAPLYFGIISLWRNINDSIFFARLYSILCILGAVFVIKEISLRYIPSINPIWPVAIFLFNPITIYTEVDVRCYAMILLLSSLLLMTFYDGYISDKPRWQSRLAYAILATIALYTHYYAGFLLAANGFALLANRRWIPFRNLCIDMILPAIGLLILLPNMPGQYEQKVLQAEQNGPIGIMMWLFQNLDSFLIASQKFDIENATARWLTRGILSIAAVAPIAYFWRKIPNLLKSENRYILAIASGLLLCYTLIFTIWGKEFVKFKFLAPLLIPLIMSVYVLLSAHKTKLRFVGYTAFLIGCYIFALANYYTPFIKSEDYKGVSAYIQEREQSNQPILVFENVHEMLFQHHYHGENELYALPFPINFDEPWGHERWLLQSEEQVREVFAGLPGDPDTVWLIVHGQRVVKFVDLNHKYLEAYVSKNFQVISEEEFPRNLTVQQLKKRQAITSD